MAVPALCGPPCWHCPARTCLARSSRRCWASSAVTHRNCPAAVLLSSRRVFARCLCIAGCLLCIHLYWTAFYQLQVISKWMSFISNADHVLQTVAALCYLLLFQHFISIITISSTWWLMKILTRTWPRTDLTGPHLTHPPGLIASEQLPLSVVFNQLDIHLSNISVALHHLRFLKSKSCGTALKTCGSQDIPYLLLPVISWATSHQWWKLDWFNMLYYWQIIVFCSLPHTILKVLNMWLCNKISFCISSGIKVSLTYVFPFLHF